jgi:hypothetical protein
MSSSSLCIHNDLFGRLLHRSGLARVAPFAPFAYCTFFFFSPAPVSTSEAAVAESQVSVTGRRGSSAAQRRLRRALPANR